MVRSYLTNGPSNVACMQMTRSNNNGSNLVELVVIKIQEQTSDHYQVGSGLSDPVTTNAPSKNPVLDFLMGTWRWGSLGWVKDFSLPPLPVPERFFFKEKFFQPLPPTYLLTSTYLPLTTYLPISTYQPPSYLLPSYLPPFLVPILVLLPPPMHRHNH